MVKHDTQQGLTLVELIISIVIISIAVAGILLVMNTTTRSSADPLIQKQALAIAESLMEEIILQPFTLCDPQDFVPATGACPPTENMGPEPGESRYGPSFFDNVNDYNGFTLPVPPGIRDMSGVPVSNLAQYEAAVQVTQTALGGIAPAESLRIQVTVTPPNGTPVVLDSYRTRHAPNAVP